MSTVPVRWNFGSLVSVMTDAIPVAWSTCGALVIGSNSEGGMPTDAAVPISRLAECVLESDADLRSVTERTGLVGPLVGHAVSYTHLTLPTKRIV